MFVKAFFNKCQNILVLSINKFDNKILRNDIQVNDISADIHK